MEKQLRIIRADIMGYCMGVRRAVEAAEQALLDTPLRPVYTYGPLIHNEQALSRLSSSGITILVENHTALPDDFNGASVVIRAHGVPPEERELLIKKHAHLIDATCPRVLMSQKRTEEYFKKGFFVFLAGDKNHGEISGLAGYAPGCVVLESKNDAEAFLNTCDTVPQKAVLLSQTTIKQAEYTAISDVLAAKIPGLIVLSTICPATMERQRALETLANQVEGILVVGGKKSANTQRLFSTALAVCGKAWHIEVAEELSEEVFSLSVIGITAGASTPDEVIYEVEQALENRIHCLS